MKPSRISCLLLFLSLSIYAAGQTGNQSIGAQAIFKPSRAIAQKISGCANTSCVVSVMQKAGASRQAIAFMRLLNGVGYMNSFREMGKVDLARYTFSSPTMYNDEGILLINGTPQVIFADDPKYFEHINIKRDPLYTPLVRKFPNIDNWYYSGVGFETMEKLPNGGQRFIFSSNLHNGCHGCEVGGLAHIAFDFDSEGNFLRTKLLRLSTLP
jgi:hypothetical protein